VTTTILSRAELAALVDELVREGTRVVAPVATLDAQRGEYRPIRALDEAALAGALPRRSLKEFFLPPSEVLLRYRQKKDGVDIDEVPTTFPPQVILGARPCDAAGVETLDKVMAWGYRDELWFGRRAATTIVSLACPGVDSTCFCAAVGLGPDATKGADALLVPLSRAPGAPAAHGPFTLAHAVESFLRQSEAFTGASGIDAADAPQPAEAYLARAVTARGEALLGSRGRPATDADEEVAEALARAARKKAGRNPALEAAADSPVDHALEARLGIAAADGGELLSPVHTTTLGRLSEWLAKSYDHPFWKTLALRCHGCGACAAVCSTCHCFDIVDEHDTCERGARRRNWDSCQTAKFTVHASTHNPRATQAERYRQRVMHKFSIYPRRFDEILCTGCGRCARACGAGMNLPEILGQLVQLAGSETQGSAR
jgi:ferredoxin